MCEQQLFSTCKSRVFIQVFNKEHCLIELTTRPNGFIMYSKVQRSYPTDSHFHTHLWQAFTNNTSWILSFLKQKPLYHTRTIPKVTPARSLQRAWFTDHRSIFFQYHSKTQRPVHKYHWKSFECNLISMSCFHCMCLSPNSPFRPCLPLYPRQYGGMYFREHPIIDRDNLI